MDPIRRPNLFAEILALALIAGGCNSGGFSGGSKKVETTEKKEDKKPAKKPEKKEDLGQEKEGDEVEVKKPSAPPPPPPSPKPQEDLDDDVVTTTTSPTPVTPAPEPQPPVVAPPPPSPPPAVTVPEGEAEVGNLKFKAVTFVNMEHKSHATEPGVWAILKSSSGSVVAAGPMTVYAACKGENLGGMAYPVVRLNVGLKYLSPQIESGQMSGSQQGSLSVCLVANGGSRAGDALSCQRAGRGEDQDRPAFWYDRQVTFSVSGNQINIDNQAGYTGGMGLYGEPENLAGGLSFAHPLQAATCGSSARNYADYNSPLVIDTNRNGKLDLKNVWESGPATRFDIRGNGEQVRTGWTSGDGLLALDVNGNGTIDSGLELFGENTHALDGSMRTDFTRFANGFQALAQFDDNLDGKVDAGDPVFSRLVVWTDINGNGISEKEEVKSLSAHNIRSLSLAYTRVSAAEGSKFRFFMVAMNEVRFTSSVEFADDSSAQMADVWFAARGDETAATAGVTGEHK
jgi:hypothetical protein